MRALLLAMTAAVTLASFDITPAEARDYPYCIKGREYGSPLGDCSFTSYQQCQATASGRLAYCDVNPFFTELRPAPRHRHRSSSVY
jgi:hypothetical protein